MTDTLTAPTADTPLIRRRFLTVQGRRVHCLRAGEGPPVVLVHSSPLNAWYLVPQIQQLARHHTCFAFDTPGFGESQALPGDTLTVADLSRALAENMAAVGLPPCPVFGTHTGAAIALSLGAHHPERVTALVLDGVPIFNESERSELFTGYFEKLEIDALGGHYSRAWTRFRDQYVWFPWTRKVPERHNSYGIGPVESMQYWVKSFFYAGRTYSPAYRAASHYGEQACVDALACTVPTAFTATESDMLHPHLARLPALGPHQEVRDIGNDKTLKDALIAEYVARYPAQGPAPADLHAMPATVTPARHMVDLTHGQLHVRHAGQPGPRALLLLHDAPGSARTLLPLIEALSEQHFVIAPDLPGCASSEGLPGEPDLATLARTLLEALPRMGINQVDVHGVGIGASIALAMAHQAPDRVRSVSLRGLALPDEAERQALRAQYAPPITLQADGSHWYRTWLMLRDAQVFYPWYRSDTADTQRRVQMDFSADPLHEQTFELMQQHAQYHQAIHAVLDQDNHALLRGLRQPLALVSDPQVPFFAYDARLRAACPQAQDLGQPVTPAALARALHHVIAALT